MVQVFARQLSRYSLGKEEESRRIACHSIVSKNQANVHVHSRGAIVNSFCKKFLVLTGRDGPYKASTCRKNTQEYGTEQKPVHVH